MDGFSLVCMELSPGFWLLSRFAMSGSGLLNKNLVKGEARNVLLSGEEVDSRTHRSIALWINFHIRRVISFRIYLFLSK